VVASVVAAFAHDPAWAFMLGAEYEHLAPLFAGALFDLRVPSENVWVTEDLTAVSMWDPPEKGDEMPGYAASIWTRYRAAAGEDAFARLTLYNEALDTASPAEDYWYLGVLATHPQRQREGLASAVLEPVLSEADRRGLPCCLETSTADNRRFYEHRGFTQVTDVVLPGGPQTWWLRRGADSG
jgi:GNAT superfamily N-acetyltransferase